MFRRRRQADDDRPTGETGAGRDEADWPVDEPAGEDPFPGDDEYPDDGPAGYGDGPAGYGDGPEAGPWDSREQYPQANRIDLGSLLIPVNPGQEVQLNVAGEQIVAASVTAAEGGLQVQAFAAPKSGGLWEDVRAEIATEIGSLGGRAQEADGAFGTELQAHVPTEPGNPGSELQPARYLGVDGPRWLLRGTISGPAASDPALAGALEEVFAGIVVVRGDHPAPPRDLLAIELPAEMRQALEEEMAQAQERAQYPNPFERGPEITETR